MEVPEPSEKHLKVLRKNFGHNQFRPMQWKIIHSIIEKKRDNCVIMATGYGKSLCYQYPAVYLDGLSIVISPLISLMQDQVLALKMSNIEACFLGSAQANKNQCFEDVLSGKCRLLYVTPEWCTSESGYYQMEMIISKVKVTLVAIDEAHCVSQWGFDFRHSYRKLGCLKKLFSDTPFLAVTATATPRVRYDICKSLQLKNASITCTSFDRPNLYLAVSYKSDDIFRDIQKLMTKNGICYKFSGPTIIYCPTKKQTEKVAEILGANGVKCAAYHADLPLNTRQNIHENFVKDKLSVIVATVAFGMGIDKPDVRCVIHYGAPKELESYYQEIGRAGRDGLPANCHVFFSAGDFVVNKYFVSTATSTDGFREHKEKMAKRMQQYLETRDCRRQLLLSHFEEVLQNSDTSSADVPKNNRCCDNCSKWRSSGKNPSNRPKLDLTDEAQMLLKAVQLFNNRFGLGTPIKFLCGISSGAKFADSYKSHELYKMGKEYSEVAWKALGRLCLREGLLEEVSCGNNNPFKSRAQPRFLMSTVRVTKLGTEYLEKGEQCGVELNATSEIEILFRKRKLQSSDAQTSSSSNSVSRRISENKEREQQAFLYKAMMDLREDLAFDHQCMPYMVANNTMLYNISKLKPRSKTELAAIDGFNEAKIEKFGDRILKKVAEFIGEKYENTSGTDTSAKLPVDPTLDTFAIQYFENMYDSENDKNIAVNEHENKKKWSTFYTLDDEEDKIGTDRSPKEEQQQCSTNESKQTVQWEEMDEEALNVINTDDKSNVQWEEIDENIFDSFPLDEIENNVKKLTQDAQLKEEKENKFLAEEINQDQFSCSEDEEEIKQDELSLSEDKEKKIDVPLSDQCDKLKNDCSEKMDCSLTTTTATTVDQNKKRTLPNWLTKATSNSEVKKRMKNNSLFKF